MNIIDRLEDYFGNSSHDDFFESNTFTDHKADKEVTEATCFLLEDILPVGLVTFKPIATRYVKDEFCGLFTRPKRSLHRLEAILVMPQLSLISTRLTRCGME